VVTDQDVHYKVVCNKNGEVIDVELIGDKYISGGSRLSATVEEIDRATPCQNVSRVTAILLIHKPDGSPCCVEDPLTGRRWCWC
jgi:hypothetical protein